MSSVWLVISNMLFRYCSSRMSRKIPRLWPNMESQLASYQPHGYGRLWLGYNRLWHGVTPPPLALALLSMKILKNNMPIRTFYARMTRRPTDLLTGHSVNLKWKISYDAENVIIPCLSSITMDSCAKFHLSTDSSWGSSMDCSITWWWTAWWRMDRFESTPLIVVHRFLAILIVVILIRIDDPNLCIYFPWQICRLSLIHIKI